ncbi:polysaccharide deacetylase family protein [Acidobacteria bacterium AH-259-O06]|nr:polysaccharide deacetylase family protein [Acidobacteria bacterium AH-259-G07]MDA2930717.1 polysaccharide deacetylase family protein [Acidobacteria bacterium AH-259-O06]
MLPIPDRLVVMTIDDGNKSDITYVAPLLKQYGFGAAFYITEAGMRGLGFGRKKSVEAVERPENFVTWEDVRKLHEDGFEIGNHTELHFNLRELSKDQIRAELEHIEMRCREHDIPVPTTFVYPGSHHSIEVVEVLEEKDYLFARRGVGPEFPDNGQGARGPVYNPAEDHPLLVPTTGYAGPEWGFEDLVWAVEQAKDGKIAVLIFHGVPGLHHPWVITEPSDFERYMKYLKDQNCTVIAMRDLAKYVDPSQGPKDPYEPIQRRLALETAAPKSD